MPAWIGPAIQGVAGLAQALIGSGAARRAERGLENMIKAYQPNAGILDYYNKALQKYSVNPYTSAGYNYQADQIRGGTAQGLQTLGDRRSTLAGLPALIQGQNDALAKAGAIAEGQQANALNELGRASQVKSAEDKYKFEAEANLLAQKAAAKNQMANAGFSNLFGGLSNLSNLDMLAQMNKTPK